MTSLPQPRAFITSLINAISAIPLSKPDLPAHRRHEQSNPLKLVPQTYQPLLTTLHVLFPTLLLPALDLLDRRLVTRLWLVPKRSDEERYESPDEDDEDDGDDSDGVIDAEDQEQEVDASVTQLPAEPPGRHRRRDNSRPPQPQDNQVDGEPISHIFTVKSSQSTHPRRRRDAVLGGVLEDSAHKMYIVRLGAWNCTCAAFVFAAFPGGIGGGHGLYGGSVEGEGKLDGGEGDEVGTGMNGGWQFGGMSLDGTMEETGAGVPCCKHLLACLLAERWEAGLGGYVEERRVGRNEMAGIVADI